MAGLGVFFFICAVAIALLYNGGLGGISLSGVSGNAPAGIVASDPTTWPTGDSIWDCCRAIAWAEGYQTPNVAQRQHNPGDITDYASTYGAGVNGITIFPDDQTGWNALYGKVSNIVNGGSSTYPADWTIAQVGNTWAAGDGSWANNVGLQLQVDPSSTSFADYVNMNG